MNNNKTKIILITSIIAITLITLVGGTLAYLSWQSSEAQNTAVTFTVGSGFSCSADGGGNITSSDVKLAPAPCTNSDYAIKREVKVNVQKNSTNNVYLDMYLNVNSISDGLKNTPNFKYALTTSSQSCKDGVVKQGNFGGATTNTHKVIFHQKEYTGSTSNDTYYLWVWLDEAETSTTTMNQTFNLSLQGSCTDNQNEAIFDTGSNVNIKMKNLAGDDTSTNGAKTVDTNITAIKHSNTMPNIDSMTTNNIVSTETSRVPIYMWYDSGTIYWWSIDVNPSLNSNASAMFRSIYNLVDVEGIENFDASNATNISFMFLDTLLSDVDNLQYWDTSNVTNMQGVFYTNPSSENAGHYSNLDNIDGLINWNISNVTNMSYIFGNAKKLSSIDILINFDTSNVTDMSYMFTNIKLISDLSPIGNWNTSNVVNMTKMFGGMPSITNLNALSKWDTSNVTNMNSMFTEDDKLTSFNGVENWNVSKVENMYFMFGMGNESLKTGNAIISLEPLQNWNVSKVTDMGGMFQNINIESFEPLANWNVSKVQNFNNTFNQTSYSRATTLAGLENWNVSSATNMENMFYQTVRLTDASAINDWNIVNVTNFADMFASCNGVHPTFSKRAGTWSNGTFTPNS